MMHTKAVQSSHGRRPLSRMDDNGLGPASGDVMCWGGVSHEDTDRLVYRVVVPIDQICGCQTIDYRTIG